MTRSRLIAAVAAWLILWIALWSSNADPSLVALAGIVAVIAAVGLVAFDLGVSVLPIRWPAPPGPAPEPDAGRLPRTLHGLDGVVRSHPTELHQRLVGLVDDRMVAHHDVDRRVTPEAANQFLTPALRDLVAGPSHRSLGTRELWAVLDDIEAL